MKFCGNCGAPVDEMGQDKHAPPEGTVTEDQEDEAPMTEEGESQTAEERLETSEEE